MATKLIHYKGDDKQSPFRLAVGEALAEEPLRIACPYINTGYLEEIVRGKTDWKLLTDAKEWLRLTGRDKRQAALDFIEEHLANIHDCSGLHAKVFIGGDGAFFGSANLTNSGLYKRDELGLQTEKTELHQELSDWFEQLWETKSPPVIKKLVDFVQRINATESTEKKTPHSSDSNGSSSRGEGRGLKHIPFSEVEPDKQPLKRKKSRMKAGKFQSFDKLVENFLVNQPDGFKKGGWEHKYKRKLSDKLKETLGKETLIQLVAEKKYDEVKQRVLSLLRKPTHSILTSLSAIKGLSNSLNGEKNQELFAHSLLEHLYGTGTPKERFDLFAKRLSELKDPTQPKRKGVVTWPLQTFFLFLSNYEENLLLKPRVTLAAIKACGYKEFYKHGDKVNWKIYSDFLEFGKYLRDRLKNHRMKLIPRDMIDIHNFIYQSVMVNQENK